jgi:tryptophanyl-tRNA synthetase
VTDSKAPGEPKDTEGSALFQIYQAFASAAETDELRKAYAAGIAWSDAKDLLFQRIDREIAPMRERYDHLVAHPQELERILLRGAEKARSRATPFLAELRHAAGLRNLGARDAGRKEKAAKAALPSFKQYREADGRFYFKLVDAQGRLLLQSGAFDSPRDAGQQVARLKADPAGLRLEGGLQAADGVDLSQIISALQDLTDAGN